MFASTYCSRDCKQTGKFIQESSLWRKVLSCFHDQQAANRPEQRMILLKCCIFLCVLIRFGGSIGLGRFSSNTIDFVC